MNATTRVVQIHAATAEELYRRLDLRYDADDQAMLLSTMSGLFAGLSDLELCEIAGMAEEAGYFDPRKKEVDHG